MNTTCYKMGSEDFEELLSRISDKSLTDKDRENLLGLMKGFWFFMNNFLESKMTKAQLRKLVELGVLQTDFSAKKKKKKDVGESEEPKKENNHSEDIESVDQDKPEPNESETTEDEENPNPSPKDSTDEISSRDRHGQNGYEKFSPDLIINYGIDNLSPGMNCPGCFGGILKPYKNGVVLQIEETAPLAVSHHILKKFRCDSCLTIISPDTDGVIEEGFGRYSFGAIATLAVYRYGYGIPFHRLEGIFKFYDLPISDSSMWDHVLSGYKILKLLEEAMWKAAANGSVIKIDDGTSRIIEHKVDIKNELLEAEIKGQSSSSVRTGIHTTCVYSETDLGDLRLFASGRHHCGEKFWEMIESRDSNNVSPLMRMSDHGSTNTEKSSKNIAAPSFLIFIYCLQHARDRFVKIKNLFPMETKIILDMLSLVYRNDTEAKRNMACQKERLKFHQEHSSQIMEKLQLWCQKQFDEHLIEPNSALGEAITYFLKYYHDVTGFLRHEGAPLDNNLCEQTVKTVKRHLKSSQSYLTNNGAIVGDCYMSLTESAKLADISPIEYIGNCYKYSEILLENPEKFLPWNYHETMSTLRGRENTKKRLGVPQINLSLPPKFKSEYF